MAEHPLHWLPLLMRLAEICDGVALRSYRSGSLRVDWKADASPVSEADREIEARVRDAIVAEAPGMGVLGEEMGDDSGRGSVRLILDPIDGTRNYVRGIPIFASLLAVEEDGEIVAGAVSAPALATRWWAVRGAGAYRNGSLVRVSAVDSIGRAQVFHAGLGGSSESQAPPGMRALIEQCERSRGFGDFYQHMLVAEGAGEVAIDPTLKPWDIAALLVIVEEAGGMATSLAGERSIHAGSLVTTNGVLHAEVLERLARPR